MVKKLSWISHPIGIAAWLGGTLVIGCAGPNRLLTDNESMAMQTAADQAQFDMHCAKPAMRLLSKEMTAPPVGQGEWSQHGRQAKYVIQADGCDKTRTFIVYCQEGDVGCRVGEK